VLINGIIKGLHVILCIDAGNAALKYLACNRSIEVKEYITQAMILRLLLVQVNTCTRKLAYLVVRMAGSSIKSAKMKQVT
jgi:hypothetical protein